MEVLVQSSGVIAVSKPPGLASESAIEWMQCLLRESSQDDAVTCVSRLDAITSGALVVARGGLDSPSAKYVLAQFAGRLVSKTYHCLCSGGPLGMIVSKFEARAPIKTISGSSSRSYVDSGGQLALTTI